MPVIHYLWVGPPTKISPATIPGQDIAGPIQMAKQLQKEGKTTSHPIKFWCLKEHEDFYKEQFSKEKITIEVSSIEDLLEEEIQHKEFADDAQYVKQYLKGVSPDNSKDRVSFKDLFSFFLLVSQPGYFFDTNVFPIKGKSITLNGEKTATTAKTEGLDSNDFFIMYSPVRGDKDMKATLEAWKKAPILGNLNCFRKADNGKIPYFGTTTEHLGIEKRSYKSYNYENLCGLFYWLEKTKDSEEISEFKENLKYSEINIQATYPSSKKILAPVSLCYLDNEVSNERLLNMEFATNEAYVLTDSKKIYYVNKTNQTCVPVYERETWCVLFDLFPRKYSNPQDKVTVGKPDIVQRVLTAIIKYPDYSTKETKLHHPSFIINTENCSLLHQAVINNNIDQVKCLLEAGAKTDVVATYEVKPNGETLKVTPLELAKYLNHQEVFNLLEQKTKEEPWLNNNNTLNQVLADFSLFGKKQTSDDQKSEPTNKDGYNP